MGSLKDQLLAAGLTDKQSVKNARKKNPIKVAKKDRGGKSKSAKLAEQALIKKAKRDRQLNLQRQQEEEKKALTAQVKQLVDGNKLDREGNEIPYSFTFNKRVKKVLVSAEQKKQLASGQIVIVAMKGEIFELVSKVVGEKIAVLDKSCVVKNETPGKEKLQEEDDYAKYQVPDDLTW